MKSIKSIDKAIKKIESIFKEQSVNQITIHRKYLPEIFDADLLEISDSDGLPTLKPLLVYYLWMDGIITKFYSNVIQLISVGIQEMIYYRVNKMMRENPKLNPHQVMKTTQALVKLLAQRRGQRKGVTPLSITKNKELEKEFESKNVPILKVSRHLPPIPKGGVELKKIHKQELDGLIVQFLQKIPELEPIIEYVQEKDLDPTWKNFRDYYMKKLYTAIKNSTFEYWQIQVSMQNVKKRFHEIYHKQGTLIQKEEEAQKFYNKYLRLLPKKKDNFGFYMCLFGTILFFSIAFIMIFILLN